MTRIRLWQWLVAAVIAVFAAQAQGLPSVPQYFDALVNQHVLPTQEESVRLQDTIKLSNPQDISFSLPLIFKAVESQNKAIVMEGSMALIGVGLRTDSAELLQPFLGKLYEMLGTDFSGLSLLILDGLRPAPPLETIPRVLAFLGRADRDTKVQAGAVGFLLKHAPGNEQVITAVEQFAARPLDLESRIRLQDGVTTLLKGNDRLLPSLAASIHDPNPAVRSSTIDHLSWLGRDALGKYATDLQRIAVDPNEPQEVRASAERALGIWAGRNSLDH